MSRTPTANPFSSHEIGQRGEIAHETHHREGRLATAIERQTARLPSDTWLWAAGASIAGSLTLHMLGRKDDAHFVGQWAPTFLCLGLYNKMVKLMGHDHVE